MTLIPEPQTVNRFPGCVAMKLHLDAESEPVKESAPALDPFAPPSPPGTGNGKPPSPALAMSLTINFSGEQEIDIPGAKALGIPSGKATFGVRRCELRFFLQGCRLPLDQVTLSASLKRSVTVETQRERATETQAGVTLGGTVGEKPGGTGSGTVGFKQGDKTVEKVTTERWQIHYAGDDQKPLWVFEVADGNPILQGTLTRESLGTVACCLVAEPQEPAPLTQATVKVEQSVNQMKEEAQPDASETPERQQLEAQLAVRFQLKQLLAQPTVAAQESVSLRAMIGVRPEDVRLTWGQVGWTPNITRNKLALIERAIALKHIGPRVTDWFSTTEWCDYAGH